MEGVALSQLFTAAKVVAGVMSAMSSLQQGAAAKSASQVQAAQARAASEREAVNAEIEANNRLEKLKQVNAAAVARGFAGGVSGFSGSAKLIQEINAKYAGKEIGQLTATAKERRSFGEIQAQMFLEAGEIAQSASIFDAISTVASTAASAYDLMPGGGDNVNVETVSGYEGYSNQVKTYAQGVNQTPNYSIGPDYRNIHPSYQSYGVRY